MPSAVSWGSAWGRARTRHASAPGQVLTLPPMAVPSHHLAFLPGSSVTWGWWWGYLLEGLSRGLKRMLSLSLAHDQN